MAACTHSEMMNALMSDAGLERVRRWNEAPTVLRGRSRVKYIIPRARQYDGKGAQMR